MESSARKTAESRYRTKNHIQGNEKSITLKCIKTEGREEMITLSLTYCGNVTQ